MKKIIQRVGVLALGALILTGSSMTAFAQDRSYTYNYDYWEDVQDSPDTYSVSGTFTYMDFGLDTNFKNPEGLCVHNDLVYVCDSGNNRIVELKRTSKDKLELSRIIDGFQGEASLNTFSNPTDLAVSEAGEFYICDKGNGRILKLDQNLNFVPMLADSITTEDNLTFTVHIDDAATWSDGTPVTAADVEYTVRRLCSPVVANPYMMYYVFEGVDDETGFVEENADSVAGIRIVDDKTITFTVKSPMSLISFENGYARYMHILPKHVIEKFSEAELTTNEWFSHPDVVSGPYMVTDFDPEHYVSYTANTKYFKGAPKIEKLNFKIVEGSQILAGLKSGEIDVTHPTMSNIPETDYESVEALPNVTVTYAKPVTHQSVFIQTANVTDKRVREALLCGIDREKILNDLMKGHGEIVDGFVSSVSPYYDSSIVPTKYDPDRAKSLLQEAGWDGSQILRFYINSSDTTFANAAAIMVAQWAEIGIQVEIKTVDFATLMSTAGSADYDLLAVQYTYPPADYSLDLVYLLAGEGSWTGYYDEEVAAALDGVTTASDTGELTGYYRIIDEKMQEDVPYFSAYVIGAQSVTANRLTGVEQGVYGFFNNIQNWEIVQ